MREKIKTKTNKMKILHTADWHLGKRLDFFSRIEEQILVMDEICQHADEQQVDLVLVAGDLFDTFNPPIEATELLYRTLKRLTNNGQRPVIAIAGNHDSPDRIDAPDPLAKECGIILIGYPSATILPFQLENSFEITNTDQGFIELKLASSEFPVRLIHTAYANEVRLKQFFGSEDKTKALNEVLNTQWNALAQRYCDTNGVNLLMTHLYMLSRGGEVLEEPDGEKPIKIGNADLVYSDAIPSSIQYTALGHLHRLQNIGGESPVVYSGSPLAYSFSEAGQKKYINIIEAFPNQPVKAERIELFQGKSLERKLFKEVEKAVEWLTANPNCLVELTMETATFLTTDERKSLYQAHQGIIHLIPKVNSKELSELQVKEVNLNQSMEDLFQDYFKSKHGNQQPNEEVMQLFNEILNG